MITRLGQTWPPAALKAARWRWASTRLDGVHYERPSRLAGGLRKAPGRVDPRGLSNSYHPLPSAARTGQDPHADRAYSRLRQPRNSEAGSGRLGALAVRPCRGNGIVRGATDGRGSDGALTNRDHNRRCARSCALCGALCRPASRSSVQAGGASPCEPDTWWG